MSPLAYNSKYDLNGNGTINALDLAIFASHYTAIRTDPNYLASCDFNNDGVINATDLLDFSNYFLSSAPSSVLTLNNLVGDMTLTHGIALPQGGGAHDSLAGYSFYTFPVTNFVSVPSTCNSLTGWLVAERDNSQLNTAITAQIEIAFMKTYLYSKSAKTWTLVRNQLPTWATYCDPDTYNYTDVVGTATAAGVKYDYPPADKALHFAHDWVTVTSDAGGSCVQIKARLTGTDKATANLGLSAGADWKTNGSTNIHQNGWGRFTKLLPDTAAGGGWQVVSMTSCMLTAAWSEYYTGSDKKVIQPGGVETQVTGYTDTTMQDLRNNPPPLG